MELLATAIFVLNFVGVIGLGIAIEHWFLTLAGYIIALCVIAGISSDAFIIVMCVVSGITFIAMIRQIVIAIGDSNFMREIRDNEKKEIEEKKNRDLFISLKEKDSQTARNLIEDGVNVNYIGEDSQIEKSVLQLAIENNDKEMVTLLLEKGANVNLVTNGKTPLDCAQDEEVITILKKYDAKTKKELDEEARKRSEENQRLQMINNDLLTAVTKQDIARVQSYIEMGADVNYSDFTRTSPLVLAVLANNMDMINLLLKNGANPYKEVEVVGGGRISPITAARYQLKNESLANFLEFY